MIEFLNISKIYGKGESAVCALNDVSLNIERGSFVAVMGKSGSGKSTLMNIAGGLDRPTSGKISVSGLDLNLLSADALADYRNKTVGFVFQSFFLEPSLTVLDNVALPLIIRGDKRSNREERAKKILCELGLDDKIHKPAGQLSGGQKQRVCIARALVTDPQLILADEPTGNLDTKTGAEVVALLKQIALSGTTVVLVTHNSDDAKAADRIVNIVDGSLVQ